MSQFQAININELPTYGQSKCQTLSKSEVIDLMIAHLQTMRSDDSAIFEAEHNGCFYGLHCSTEHWEVEMSLTQSLAETI